MSVQKSGVITVATAGTAVQGANVGPGTYIIKADPANTGDYVYVGNDGAGDVSSSTGYKMAKTDTTCITLNNLNELWFDVTTNGDKITWLRADHASQ